MHASNVTLFPKDLKRVAPFARGHMVARSPKQRLNSW